MVARRAVERHCIDRLGLNDGGRQSTGGAYQPGGLCCVHGHPLSAAVLAAVICALADCADDGDLSGQTPAAPNVGERYKLHSTVLPQPCRTWQWSRARRLQASTDGALVAVVISGVKNLPEFWFVSATVARLSFPNVEIVEKQCLLVELATRHDWRTARVIPSHGDVTSRDDCQIAAVRILRNALPATDSSGDCASGSQEQPTRNEESGGRYHPKFRVGVESTTQTRARDNRSTVLAPRC